jgi:Fic family protein
MGQQLNFSDVSRLTGLSPREIQKAWKELVDKGYLVPDGKGGYVFHRTPVSGVGR